MLGNQKDSRPGVIVVYDPKNGCDEDRLFVKSLRDCGLTVEEKSLEQIVGNPEYITVEVVVARDCWPAQNEDHDPFKINKLTLLDLARRSVLRLWNTPDGRGGSNREGLSC